jgi:hypothetical protein
MRKPSRLWQALERILGLLAVPAFWREYCGPDFPLIEPHLRPTDDIGATYPCPYPTGGFCPRKIIDYGGGEYVAICRDPYKICKDVPLAPKEVLVHKLDLAGFTKMIAPPLGIRWHPPESLGDHTWAIGLSDRRSSRNQAVFFIVLPDSVRFAAALNTLLLDIPGPFVAIAPTNRHRTPEVQQRLQARGINFVALEDQLLLDGNGSFISIEPLHSSDQIRPTPVAERPQAVKAFCAKHGCKVKHIYEAAGVDESDFYKWRRGELPDSSNKCRDIERVLLHGLPKRSPR